MVKTLVKHGNSWALIIDKPILELLHISPDTPLEVSTSDGRSLTVRAVADEPESRQRLLKHSLNEIDVRYGDMLQRLAR
jgi:antitoxin component of MazEF toxin-antitoxin module